MTERCAISRRQLLRGRLWRAESADRESPPRASNDGRDPTPGNAADPTAATGRSARAVFPVIRPPGAVTEPAFLSRCTKCDECVTACPHDAITHAPIRFRGAAGTPMIDPAAAPCRMCDGLPCVAACPEEALTLDAVGPIATARLLDYNCLAHQGSFCTVCSEHCPTPDAITLDRGRPTIHLDHCTGCGVCHHVCPAPTNAVAVMPIALPPPPTHRPSENGTAQHDDSPVTPN